MYISVYVNPKLLIYATLPPLVSLVAQRLKRLPAMQETWVQSLGQEDPLENEIANHSSILAWRIPWTEEPGRLQSTGSQSQTLLSKLTHTHTIFVFLGLTYFI